MALVPLLVVWYSIFLVPPEVEFLVFGVRFNAYRVAVLLSSVPALWMTMRNAKGAISPIDIAVAAMAFWMVLSFILIYGFESGLVRGAGIVIDTALSYFVARVCIKTPDDLRRMLLLGLPAVLFAGGLLVVESATGELLYRPFAAKIFGNMAKFAGGEETGRIVLEKEFRLGLLRAYGPFMHPILAGAVMVAFLPIYYFSGLRSWPYILGVGVGLAGFFSLSSAAFLALIIAIGAIAIYHAKPHLPKISWWTIVSLIGLLGWAAHMASKNGIISVIARLTLTPATADYRRLIWEYGSISIANNPWFGIGYRQWERLYWMTGDSVDAHFLLLGMRHGLIVPLLLLFGIAYGMIRLGVILPNLNPKDKAFMIGLNISMFMYLIVGQTVNYFGSTNLVFMFLVAFLASMVSWGNGVLKMQSQMRLMLTRMRLQNAIPA
jgi:O-antigen ligase